MTEHASKANENPSVVVFACIKMETPTVPRFEYLQFYLGGIYFIIIQPEMSKIQGREQLLFHILMLLSLSSNPVAVFLYYCGPDPG